MEVFHFSSLSKCEHLNMEGLFSKVTISAARYYSSRIQRCTRTGQLIWSRSDMYTDNVQHVFAEVCTIWKLYYAFFTCPSLLYYRKHKRVFQRLMKLPSGLGTCFLFILGNTYTNKILFPTYQFPRDTKNSVRTRVAST